MKKLLSWVKTFLRCARARLLGSRPLCSLLRHHHHHHHHHHGQFRFLPITAESASSSSASSSSSATDIADRCCGPQSCLAGRGNRRVPEGGADSNDSNNNVDSKDDGRDFLQGVLEDGGGEEDCLVIEEDEEEEEEGEEGGCGGGGRRRGRGGRGRLGGLLGACFVREEEEEDEDGEEGGCEGGERRRIGRGGGGGGRLGGLLGACFVREEEEDEDEEEEGCEGGGTERRSSRGYGGYGGGGRQGGWLGACGARMSRVTAVSLLWSLLSILVAGACAFSFFYPSWITHPDRLHSFGLFTQCVRDPGGPSSSSSSSSSPSSSLASSSSSSSSSSHHHHHHHHPPRALCRGYGPGGRVDVRHIPAGAWQASTLLFGGGAGLQCVGALVTLLLLVMPSHPYGGHKLALLCGYVQTLAGESWFFVCLCVECEYGQNSHTYN